MKRTELKRKTPLVSKSTLARKTPLVAKVRLESRSELKRATPLKAKPPKAGAKAGAKARKPAKLAHLPKRGKSKKEGVPVRDPGFLAFVRTHACDACGATQFVQAHHFGKHGMGTKGSDHEATPLCYYCHVEGWHRHGTLPGRERDEWLARWSAQAEAMLARYEAQGRPAARRFAASDLSRWRERFLAVFADVEPGENGAVAEDFASSATRWLLRHVWPSLPEGDEWFPVLSWHHGELLVQAESLAGVGVFDLEMVINGAVQNAA